LSKGFYTDIEKASKLPTEFVAEFSEATTEAHAAWEEAKKKSDFSMFKPHLEKNCRAEQEGRNLHSAARASLQQPDRQL